jgi:hypothetical protein
MKLYRFSPIQDQAQLTDAVSHVAEQASRLCTQVIGEQLPITYLTIFAHYSDEYENLVDILHSLGETMEANNGLRTKLEKPIGMNGQTITDVRVRQPDPYRMQVGCCDFGIDDYRVFKQSNLLQHSQNLRLIKRPKYEMIEFFDPNYDVLAYVIGEADA